MTISIRRIIAGNKPVFLLIAGPNGASKSTFSENRLKPLGFPCIDPDGVAKELFGKHAQTREEAIQATIEATQRVRQHLLKSSSVALESVFSDTKGHKLRLIDEARTAGFKTVLVFIGVNSPEICIARVQDRVEGGGHDVPDDVIRDRFPRCFENLRKALTKVDFAFLIDNSGFYGPESPVDGMRHYQFGIVEAGVDPEIRKPVPNWFKNFRIADGI